MRLAVGLMVMTSLSSAAGAAEVATSSRIDAVTVFTSGAEITRVAKVKIDKGEHTIVLADLPAAAVGHSIRVEGKSGGGLEIGSVDNRRLSVPRADALAAESERKALEDEIEKLRDQLRLIEGQIEAAATQKRLIDNLTNLPSRPAPTQGAEKSEDWAHVLGVVASGIADASRLALTAEVQKREVERKINDLKRKLSALPPLKEERTEVKILVTAAAALDADLTVRYQVPSAHWRPFYDARLAMAEKANTAKLALVRRAEVANSSGEDWQDVALRLSTARPGGSTAAPDLNMLSVDFEPEPKPMAAAAPAPVTQQVGAPMARGALRGRAEKMAEEAPAEAAIAADALGVVAPERRAQVSDSGLQVTYDIPGRVSVARTGEVKKVQIETLEVEPELTVRSVPRFDATAYLYAKLVLPQTTTPLLSGAVSLFRDGVFVGNGRLPQLAGGEDHELGFGADDRVKVKRIVTEDKKGETGMLTTSRVEDRNYVIKVRNLHTRPMTVQILDRVPVTMHQDIKVEVRVPGLQPTKKDFNDRRGTYQWELKLGSDEEKQVAFGYRVAWPADKNVQYRELTPEQQRQNVQTKF